MVHLSRKIFKMATKCRWRPRSRRSRASGRRSSLSTRSRVLTTWRPSPSMKPGSRVSSNLCHVSRHISPDFFAQSACIKIASPQAARIRIFFYRKTSSVAPSWGIWIKDTLLRGWKREKSPGPGGIQTHDLSVMRYVLYSSSPTPFTAISRSLEPAPNLG